MIKGFCKEITMTTQPIFWGQHTPLSQPFWPVLPPLTDWEDTCTTLMLWTQIVGKIRLALAPPVNHFWGCMLYVTTRGLTTSPIPYSAGMFSIEFDLTSDRLWLCCSNGCGRSFALEPMSVAEFYRQLMQALDELGITVKIYARPVEVAEAIPFAEDTTHASYDSATVHCFWQALVAADRVFAQFRAQFIGKASPVLLFWGSLDLAVSRFSGRTAPLYTGSTPHCPNRVMEEAYSHELSSAGFWAGTGLGEAAFYSYAYPAPAGFSRCKVEPDAAYFHEKLGEFILPYEAVRTAVDPAQMLLSFLQTTYEGAANLAQWDRSALERASAGRGRDEVQKFAEEKFAEEKFAEEKTTMTDIIGTLTSKGSFTSFLQALQETDLRETLQKPGPFTVFAPNDQAFATAALRDLLSPESQATLKSTLLYHIVPGEFRAAQISAMTSVRTLGGRPLAFEVQAGSEGAAGQIQIDNDSRVVQADIAAGNGIIHVIDGVLTP